MAAFLVIEGPSRLAQERLKIAEGKPLWAAHGSGKQLFPLGHLVTIYSYKSKINEFCVYDISHRKNLMFLALTRPCQSVWVCG